MHSSQFTTGLCLGTTLAVFCLQASAETDYLADVKPILQERCVACHGGLKQQASLRLDTVEFALRGGETGAALVPHKPAASLLMARVSDPDLTTRMPPEGPALTAAQIAILETWIAEGAVHPEGEMPQADPRDHWAFRVPVRPLLPRVENSSWARNPLDLFLLAELEKRGLKPSPESRPEILLRRVYLNLVGLPPTRAQQAKYLSAPTVDNYARIVDRLLEMPQHGERWGRHWMDVWRYSDWYGRRAVPDALNSYGQIWRWRDWIVRSLNADKGYDTMVTQMLAADEIDPTDQANAVATGFIVRNYFRWNYATWMKDLVEHTGKAFLGLTLNCCHCHDHKYDPISNQEYFQFRAFFEPIDIRQERVPGEPDPGPYPEYKLSVSFKPMQTGMVRIADAKLDAKTFIYNKGESRNLVEGLPPVEPAPPAILGGGEFEFATINLPPRGWYPGLRDYVRQEEFAVLKAELATAKQVLKDSAALAAAANTAADQEYARLDKVVADNRFGLARARLTALDAKILADNIKYLGAEGDVQEASQAASQKERLGNLHQAKYELAQASRAVCAAQKKDLDDPQAKMELSAAQEKQAAAEKNVVACEKAAAETSDQYASLGPVYPSQSTGRRTALAERIVSSNNPLTARVAVNHIWKAHFGKPLVGSPDNFGRNGERPTHPELLDWLAVELMDNDWKMKHIHRLILNSQAYRMSSNPGRTAAVQATKDSDNVYYWRFDVRRMEAEVIRDSILSVAGQLEMTLGGKHIPDTEGLKTFRRSLYIEHHGEGRIQWLDLFDAPNPTDCYQRTTSVRPQQALALANSELAYRQAILLARALSAATSESEPFVVNAFQQTLARDPSSDERAAALEFLQAQSELFRRLPAKELHVTDEENTVLPSVDPDVRARENLIHALFNHSDFITVR